MGLKVEAYPGFKTVTAILPTDEWAKSVALAFMDESRAFYMEPYPDDQWFIKVDAEHKAFLDRLLA